MIKSNHQFLRIFEAINYRLIVHRGKNYLPLVNSGFIESTKNINNGNKSMRFYALFALRFNKAEKITNTTLVLKLIEMGNKYEEKQEQLLKQTAKTFRVSFINFSNFKIESVDNKLQYFLLISYFQLFFMNLQLIRKYIPEDDSFMSSLFQVLEDFANFDNIFSYKEYDEALILVGGFISLYLIIQVISLSIVTYSAFYSRPSINFAKVWSFLVKIHAPVLFLPINNLLARLVWEFKNEDLKIFENNGLNQFIFCLSIIGYVTNVLFAVLPYIFLSNVLPNENSLSSKLPFQDQAILYQKLIISLIGKLLPEMSTKPWIIVSISSIISGLNHFWFIYSLPRYNFKALRLDLYLNRFSTISLTISFVILLINQIPDFEVNSCSFIIIQLGLSFFCSTFFDLFFQKMMVNLFFAPIEKLNPYRALHKILILKYIRKTMKIINLSNNKIDSYYFFFASSNLSLGKIFGEKAPYEEMNLNEKFMRNQIKRNFLERLDSHYKSNHILKIILAQFYTRNLRLFPLAIKTLAQIRYPSFLIKASIDLLHLKIQRQVLSQSQNVDSELKFYDYIKAKAEQNQLMQQIKAQLAMQKIFWIEYNQNKPEILKLEELAEEIHKKKNKIGKYWSHLEHKLDESLYPLHLLYAQYQILMNHSAIKGQEYLQKYNLFSEKYKKVLENKFSISSILQKSNCFNITLRTDQDHLGTIINCSKSIKKLLGYEIDFLKDSNIKVLMTPYIAASHHDFLSDYIKTGVSKFMDKLQTVFVKNQSGYLQKASLLASIHPFVHQEAYLTGFFRIIKDPYEYILITPNGEIDSFTEGIGSRLMLRNRKINICEICPGFDKANKAFNSFAFKKLQGLHQNSESLYDQQKENLDENQHHNEMDINTGIDSVNRLLSTQNKKNSKCLLSSRFQVQTESKENEAICENYSRVGEKIKFLPLTSSKGYDYLCRVNLELFRNSFMKLIEIQMNDDDQSDFEELDDIEEVYEERKANIKEYVSHLDTKCFKSENFEERRSSNVFISSEAVRFKENTDFPLTSPENTRNSNNLTKLDMRIAPARTLSLRKKFNSTEIIETNMKDRTNNRQKENDPKKLVLRNSEFINYSSSLSSKSETQKRNQIYIDQSLDKKYYHNSAIGFLIYFFSSAAIVIASQVYLPFSVRSSLHKIKDLTTALDLANSGNDAFTNLDLEIRASHAAETGFIALPSISFGIKEALNAEIPDKVLILKDANYNLNIAIKNLDSYSQEIFQSNSIRIYEINADLTPGDYREFEMFNAVNILIQKLLQIKQKYSKTRKYELDDLVYFIINSSNDILERSVNTISVLLNDTRNSVINALDTVNFSQLVCLIVMILAFVISLYFFGWMYRTQIELSKKFLGLTAKTVHTIQSKLNKFDEYLESEDIHEGYLEQNNNFTEVIGMNISAQVKPNKMIKILRKDRLILQYIKRIFIFSLIMGTYFFAVSIPFRDVFGKTKVIGKKIEKLAITQSTLYEVSILTFILGQLGSGDTKTLVRNRPPEQELEIGLESMSNKVNEFFLAFKKGNEDIDPEFAPILQDDACKFLNPIAKAVCEGLSQESQTLGLLSLIAKFYTLARQIYDDYKTSIKSISYLQRMSLNVYGDLGLQTYVLRETLLLITGKARIDFNQAWEETDIQTFTFLWINTFLFVMGLSAIWFFVLSPFVETVNRIKKILRIFPIHVLLQNPNLKGLIRITSKKKQGMNKIDF